MGAEEAIVVIFHDGKQEAIEECSLPPAYVGEQLHMPVVVSLSSPASTSHGATRPSNRSVR